MKYHYLGLITLMLLAGSVKAEDSIWSASKKDYAEYFRSERLIRMGYVFAGGALLANTNFDQNFQDSYQDSTRSVASDDFSVIVKQFGEGRYLIPIAFLSYGISKWKNNEAARDGIGKWGELTARAYLVGGPPVLLAQVATGASRPSEYKPHTSNWKPFADSNGVSGHAFIGSVPFLTMAYMSDSSLVKSIMYMASTLTPWSRVNDNQHYLSQAILGWYMGWEAVDTVNSNESKHKSLAITPVAFGDTISLQLSMRW